MMEEALSNAKRLRRKLDSIQYAPLHQLVNDLSEAEFSVSPDLADKHLKISVIIKDADLTEYQPSYDGRMQEPVTLPAKIPLLLLLGAEGIAVGMATKIMPHNFCELLRAQKKLLKGKTVTLYPDFQQGGLLDVSGYGNGNGRLKCRAKIVEKNEKTIVIEEIPYSTTTTSIIDSIEKADKSGNDRYHDQQSQYGCDRVC